MEACLRALAAVALALFVEDAAAAQEEETVGISLTLPADYHSGGDLPELAEIVANLPPREVTVEEGETISQIVLDEFRFGLKDAPNTFHRVSSEILRMNGLESARSLKAGRLLVPSIPQMARKNPNTDKILNKAPIIYSFNLTPVQRVVSTSACTDVPGLGTTCATFPTVETDLLAKEPPSILAQGRPASQLATMQFRVSLSYYERLRASTLSSRMSVNDKSIEVDTGACDGLVATPPYSSVLSAAESQKIADLLSLEAKRESTLFVLDSGWPNEATQAASTTLMYEYFDALRADLKFKDPTPARKQPKFSEPVNKHNISIYAALEELRALDASSKVRVVFLPLTRDQDSGSLLEELVFLGRVRRLMGESAGKDSPPKDILKTAESDAALVVARLPSSNAACAVKTDKALIDSLMILGDWRARHGKGSFFVSESWTVRNETLQVAYPDPLLGAAVVAAGNVPDRDIYTQPSIDFAQRSIGHKDTVAVVNLARGKDYLQCDSSTAKVPAEFKHEAAVVGFDGRVTEQVCGTSFAAPRVAWLLALYEAFRVRELEPQFWSTDLNKRLLASRSGDGIAGFWLEPSRLLDQVKEIGEGAP